MLYVQGITKVIRNS